VQLITLIIIITGMPTTIVMISKMMAAKAPITTMMIVLIELQAVQVSSAMAAPAVALSQAICSALIFTV
jgi:hypothetical protein